jgi:multiple sugar transport system ATP-binding protein
LEQTVAAEGFPFTVQVTDPLGPHIMLTGETVGQQVRVLVPPESSVRVGAALKLRPRFNRVVWMDPASGLAIRGGELREARTEAAGN